MAEPPALSLRDASKRYENAARPALRQVSLEVARGELLALLGESGSGKTTLLRLIAGFEDLTSGDVSIHGVPVTGLPPERRGVTMVFQEALLFPHLTVRENIGFGLAGQGAGTTRHRVDELVALVGIPGLEDRYPHEISGGQAQRTALARALAPRPALLLLDEPFNNLDAVLRQRLIEEVRAAVLETGTTTILVTHDRGEALAFANRLAVIRDGEIAQVGGPEELYERPRSAYVAHLLGKANLLVVERGAPEARTPLGSLAGYATLDPGTNGHLLVCVRPSAFELLDPNATEAAPAPEGTLSRLTFLGDHWEADVRLDRAVCGLDCLTVHLGSRPRSREGGRVRVRLVRPRP